MEENGEATEREALYHESLHHYASLLAQVLLKPRSSKLSHIVSTFMEPSFLHSFGFFPFDSWFS